MSLIQKEKEKNNIMCWKRNKDIERERENANLIFRLVVVTL